ncbi:MAG: PD-(D/E)XK nuclease family transposase [Clostridiales bacterium]|nr:PD-(D/E)XK nuclease family transposase [Clostridiales bacterium]
MLSVTRDFVFKRLFDPDKFPYLEELLSLVLGFKVKIKKSLSTSFVGEFAGAKSNIFDLLVVLEDGSYALIEIQVESDSNITQRLAIYSSDALRRDYSVSPGQLKKDLGFKDVNKVYAVVFMAHEPESFNASKNFINRFEQLDEKELGFRPEFYQRYYVVNLSRFMRENVNKKIVPTTTDEESLFDWLRFIADDRLETKKALAQKDVKFERALKELKRMSLSKSEILESMQRDYFEFDVRCRIADAVEEKTAAIKADLARVEEEKRAEVARVEEEKRSEVARVEEEKRAMEKKFGEQLSKIMTALGI